MAPVGSGLHLAAAPAGPTAHQHHVSLLCVTLVSFFLASFRVPLSIGAAPALDHWNGPAHWQDRDEISLEDSS